MVTIFNRKELIVTLSMEVQANVRDILDENHMDYVVKIKNLLASPWFSNQRSRTGTAFINGNCSYEYKIYVHKEDYEKAMQLIRNC